MIMEQKTKCRTSKCNARCCYNIPFDENELERFADRIVNPVKFVSPVGPGRHGIGLVAFTDENPERNKCPFLRRDFKCNIYENRPEVCRLFGVIDRLPCRFIKK